MDEPPAHPRTRPRRAAPKRHGHPDDLGLWVHDLLPSGVRVQLRPPAAPLELEFLPDAEEGPEAEHIWQRADRRQRMELALAEGGVLA